MPVDSASWILSPPKDGLGYAASITRRRKDGSVMWTALPAGRCRAGGIYGRLLGGPECDRELLVVLPDSART
jgi:hypothetical protein